MESPKRSNSAFSSDSDGVDKVINDKDFAEQIVDGGLQILEENQYTSMASKTFEVYQSILE